MREVNAALKAVLDTAEPIKETPKPQERTFEWNEVIAIVSEFVWRDVPPLPEGTDESEAAYRRRLNDFAEQEVLKIMYASSPEV